MHTQGLGAVRLRTSYGNVQTFLERNFKQYAKKKKTHVVVLNRILQWSGRYCLGQERVQLQVLVNMLKHKHYLSAGFPSRARRRLVSQSVRPQWLGFLKHFYRQEDLTLSPVQTKCHWKPDPRTDMVQYIMTHKPPGLPPHILLQWVLNALSSSVIYAGYNLRKFYLPS